MMKTAAQHGAFTAFLLVAVVVGNYLLDFDPFQLWVYLAVAVIASEQIYTRVYRGNGQYEEFTLLLTTAGLATLYLPPVEAVLAVSAGSLIANMFRIGADWYKRLLNTVSITLSSVALVGTYHMLNHLFADAIWPSAAAAVSLFIGCSVFDTVNSWFVSSALIATKTVTFNEAVLNWYRTLAFPAFSGLSALGVGLLIEMQPACVAFVPLLFVMFLKQNYRMPKKTVVLS